MSPASQDEMYAREKRQQAIFRWWENITCLQANIAEG
jgi:hypothetical protein